MSLQGRCLALLRNGFPGCLQVHAWVVVASVCAFSHAGVAIAQAEHGYFGNLHSHTSYSGGSGTPEDAYKAAKKAGLDFLAITEHNHSQAGNNGDGDDEDLIANDHKLYCGAAPTSLISTAKRVATDKFVAIYRQEVSSIGQGNHVNIFDVDAVVDEAEAPNGSFDKLVNDRLPNHRERGDPAFQSPGGVHGPVCGKGVREG